MKRIPGISLKRLAVAAFALLIGASSNPVQAQHNPLSVSGSPIEGKWDITLDWAGKPKPSWLEVRHSGNKYLVGYFVGPGGSARPVSSVKFADNKVSFTLPPQWDDGSDLVVEATLENDKLTGTLVDADGKKYNFTAVRAPLLFRGTTAKWGTPIKLFNGKDLSGWHTEGENQWKVENGILSSPNSGSNLISDQKFNDFKLHVEFKCPPGSNSGVYLRGRYEVQIDDAKGKPALVDHMSAIYGFIAPIENPAKDPGEWQTYDITLIGRLVTVVANGKTVICQQIIPGVTGGALDSNEGEPGPIYFQGDHGPIQYRNIVITPAQ